MNIKKQMAEMYGLPYKGSGASFILLRRWQKKRREALKRRKLLKANGAKKIVFIIDENSGDDDRFDFGHKITLNLAYFALICPRFALSIQLP